MARMVEVEMARRAAKAAEEEAEAEAADARRRRQRRRRSSSRGQGGRGGGGSEAKAAGGGGSRAKAAEEGGSREAAEEAAGRLGSKAEAFRRRRAKSKAAERRRRGGGEAHVPILLEDAIAEGLKQAGDAWLEEWLTTESGAYEAAEEVSSSVHDESLLRTCERVCVVGSSRLCSRLQYCWVWSDDRQVGIELFSKVSTCVSKKKAPVLPPTLNGGQEAGKRRPRVLAGSSVACFLDLAPSRRRLATRKICFAQSDRLPILVFEHNEHATASKDLVMVACRAVAQAFCRIGQTVL